MNWIEDANTEKNTISETFSFYEYFHRFQEDPVKHLRPTYKYLLDMLIFFGKTSSGKNKLFEKDSNNAPAVYGQEAIEKQFEENLRNFKDEGFNNKFLLLVGPNGSSKSSLVKKIMKGAEEYSETDEGSIYTFSWIFPINSILKGTLGLNGNTSSGELSTYSNLEDKEIAAILTSELKDHPLLLIPTEYRKKSITEALTSHPKILKSIEKSYFWRGDLSKRNRMIYDALLKSYRGRHDEVLKHIRVERFTISRRYSSGAVTIEPQLHVDAKMQQITMDKRLALLPPSLQSLNLFSMSGEVIQANRGVLEFSDLLKRPLDTYKYLLTTIETSNINLSGILTELDIFFIGTSNEVHLNAFKQHPDFNSFKGRFNFIKVPYLLNYKEEKRIYNKQIKTLNNRSNFCPQSLEVICKFAVMTRIRASMSKNYSDPKITAITTGLSPLEKINIYVDKNFIPKRLDIESAQILKYNIDLIKKEFENDNLYEGKFGISPRDIKNIIYQLSETHKEITFIEIIDFLKDLIQKKNKYDFLNMPVQGNYHNPDKFIQLVKDEALNNFDKILRSSLGLVDERSYEDYLKRYIQNINALIKEEKIKNPITGKYEEYDKFFLNEFENNINIKEDKEQFRRHLISKLGAWYLDNPKEKIIFKIIFPDIVDRLKESFRNEQKKSILTLSKNLVFFESELYGEDKDNSSLSRNNREHITLVIKNLKNKHGYSQNASITLIKFLLKESY